MKLIKVQQFERIYTFKKPMNIKRVYLYDGNIAVDFAEKAEYTSQSIACTTRWILYRNAKIYFEDGTIVCDDHSMTQDALYKFVNDLANKSFDEVPEVSDIMDIIF